MNLTQAVARLRELTSKFEEASETRLVVVYEPDSALFGSDEYAHLVFIEELYDDKGRRDRIMLGMVKKKDLTDLVFNGEQVTVFLRFEANMLITQEYHE